MKKGFAVILAGCLAAAAMVFLILRFAPAKEEKGESGTVRDTQVTLRWLIYGKEYKDTDDIVSAFNERLHQQFPGISVELEIVPLKNYKQNWDMKMAGNEAIDIAWMGSEALSFSEEMEKGNLMALDYLLSTYGRNLTDQIPEELWDKQKRGADSIYAIPVLGPLYRGNRILVANKSLADRYARWDEIIRVNQDALYTTEECFEGITDFLEEVKAHNALGKGVSYSTIIKMADKGYEGIYGEDCPFVIRIFDDYPVVYNKYTLPSYEAAYRVMAQWYQVGYIRSDAAYDLNPTEQDGKISGNILYLSGSDDFQYLDQKPEYEAVEGDLEGYYFISRETCRNCLVIPKTAQYPTEAMKVIDYLHSKEGAELYRLLVNGIEKEQYIKISQDSDVIARMTGEDRDYRYGLVPVTIGNLFQNFELEEGQFQAIQDNNREAIHSPLEGFQLDTRMFAIELARINLIVDQYEEILNQGSSENWEETYGNFIQEMNDAGSLKVISEVQKQVDAFMKMKGQN